MTKKDAYLFPVYGSGVLFSLYVAYKFLPKNILNFIFTTHFTIMGLFCATGMLEFPISKLAPERWSKIYVIKRKFNLNLIFYKTEFNIEWTYL